MKYSIRYILVFCICFLVCSKIFSQVLVDKEATSETKALFLNLKKIQEENKILFGQHDATLYGHSWKGDNDRSDAKDITGSHPALLGLDYMDLTTTDTDRYETAKLQLINAVKSTYKNGGVVTFCWHMSNPANDGSFYWEQNPVNAVSDILPNGTLHEKYKSYLNIAAEVTKEFRGKNGELIPVIFRPFHEFDGDWFWWGKGHCTREEFIDLWKFTVEYMRDSLQIHNFLYAFSPDCKFNTKEEYLDYYPGDEYVDILGFDDYWDFRPDGNNNPALAEQKLKIVSDIALSKGKIAAITETGLEGVTQTDWFTKTLFPILQRNKLAYVMLWRNAHDMPHHHYVPYKGHAAEDDFVKFYKNENIIFENNIPDMYHFKYNGQ